MSNLISRNSFKELAGKDRLISDIAQITKHEFMNGQLLDYFTIIPNAKGGIPVATASPTEGYITTKSKHSPTPDFVDYNAPVLQQYWNPQVQSVRIRLTYGEFVDQYTQWLLGNGHGVVDLRGTTILQFLVDKIRIDMELDVLRISLFGKSDIASANILRDNANKAKFYDNINSGLVETFKTWKKGGANFDHLASNFDAISKNVNNAANEGPTLDHQYEGFTNTFAKDIFRKLTRIKDGLRHKPDTLYCNWSLAENWRDWQENNVNLESSKSQEVTGAVSNTYRGYPIVVLDRYETWRATDFAKDKRTTAQINANAPERNFVDTANFAVFANKMDLQVGICLLYTSPSPRDS